MGVSSAQDATPQPGSELPIILWHLEELTDAEGTATPDDPARYNVQFLPDGLLAGQADCNRMRGRYEVDGDSLTIGPLASTRVLCPEGSLDNRYLAALEQVASFAIAVGPDASDRLTLTLTDGGSLVFRPALTDVVWQWREFQGGDGTIVTAPDPSRYTLEFLPDGEIRLQADCNGGRGSATIDGSSIEIVAATTLMGCGPESKDGEFLRYVSESNSFVVRDGSLALALPADSGIASFDPVLPTGDEATPAATPEA